MSWRPEMSEESEPEDAKKPITATKPDPSISIVLEKARKKKEEEED